MKKLAIFVEGQTERIFVSKLVREIAGEKKVFIATEKPMKSRKGERIFTVIDVTKIPTDEKYYVLIRDCGGDSCVMSDIKDYCEKLSKSGYEKIVGLRDVYPIPASDIPKLRKGLVYGIPTRYIPIHLVLAVMEIEAWFLAETTHFRRIHDSLTPQVIASTLGFDPTVEDVESRPHPSEDLKTVYKVAGLSYKKRKNSVERTVEAIDYGELYLEQAERVKSLGEFVDQIDTFLT